MDKRPLITFTAVRKEVVISNKAVQSLQRIVARIAENSLISSEDVRSNVMNHMRKLTLNPENNTQKANFETLRGHYRSTEVSGYRIYYKVEEQRILVLDIIMEKPAPQL